MAAGLVVISSLSACDEFPGLKAGGVTLAEDETTPRFVYVLCAGQRIERVQLVDQVGDSPFDGDDEMLWAIASDSGSEVDEIDLGRVPPGFAEETSPPSDLEEFEELVAVFDATAASRFGVGFDPRDLRPGRVLTFDGSTEPIEEFRKEAASRCP